MQVAKFEFVSADQFSKDAQNYPGANPADFPAIHASISLPARSTSGSAGYDFVTPFDITLAPGETALIPTGVRVQIDDGWFLALFPRSGLGFKFRLQLDNTVGIIDSDYYHAENEGHIMAKITNDSHSEKTLHLNAGDRFMQGIFLPYGITVDDAAYGLRVGGFGSTGR